MRIILSTRPNHADKKRQLVERLYNDYSRFYAERNYPRALAVVRQARTLSTDARIIESEALCLSRMGRTQEAYALASRLGSSRVDLRYFDLMADICGALGKVEENRSYGSRALAQREVLIANEPFYEIPNSAPPTPRENSLVISYSLFGNNPRYCEVAIMNCLAAANLLPGWRCRFYCDETVPADVRQRLVENGGEMVLVDDATRASLPALMWRFLAADDPNVTHYLMRDADSLIGEREAAAVNAWLNSGKWFHLMRDYYTHTEVMLAGLWGGCTGVISDMRQEMLEFLRLGQFDKSHVDQHFLRKRIWPTARQSVLSHDSQFQFFNNEPFPHVPGASLDPKHHVGANLSSCIIAGQADVADGQRANVTFLTEQGQKLCAYEVSVRGKRWELSVPDSFADKLETKQWIVRVS